MRFWRWWRREREKSARTVLDDFDLEFLREAIELDKERLRKGVPGRV